MNSADPWHQDELLSSPVNVHGLWARSPPQPKDLKDDADNLGHQMLHHQCPHWQGLRAPITVQIRQGREGG